MLPFTAVVPMDVAQQAYIQVRAEERVRFGSDINAARAVATRHIIKTSGVFLTIQKCMNR